MLERTANVVEFLCAHVRDAITISPAARRAGDTKDFGVHMWPVGRDMDDTICSLDIYISARSHGSRESNT